MLERIERDDGKFWTILVGYGRIQRARAILMKNLPDAVKRAQVADPDASDIDLMRKASPEDIANYNAQTGIEIAKLVLHEAHDWDKAVVTVADYVDGYLPEEIGSEILRRVGIAVAAATMLPESKKNSR